MSDFEKTTQEMKDLCNDFIANIEKSGNKAANKRARKISNELSKTGKIFRKQSVEFDKQ